MLHCHCTHSLKSALFLSCKSCIRENAGSGCAYIHRRLHWTFRKELPPDIVSR